jgi:mannose-6-phosphate isomerase-like protein (cupin superfamily)
MPSIQKINLAQKFAKVPDTYSPRIVAQVNDHAVKLSRVLGDFVWHKHENEDEMFLVTKGKLVIKLRDGDLVLEPGEFAVIPKGVEHCPVSEEECHVVLFEPKDTISTGDVRNEMTVLEPEWV